MKFGICIGPDLLFQHQDQGDLDSFLAELACSGVDYWELPVGAVLAPGWERLQALVATHALPVPAFNSFLPAAHRITGPDVDLPAVLEFCRLALERCRTLGGDVVVLGSAGARRVPPGFDFEQAEQQFCDFCRLLGPVAADAGIDIAIEPLNAQEDNLIVTVTRGAELVDIIDHPRICLLADFYHMFQEQETVSAVAAAGSRLRHAHLADIGRVAPGYAPQGEADFAGFFRALRESGYTARPDARCSFEGTLTDLQSQAAPLLRLLRKRWLQSAPAPCLVAPGL